MTDKCTDDGNLTVTDRAEAIHDALETFLNEKKLSTSKVATTRRERVEGVRMEITQCEDHKCPRCQFIILREIEKMALEDVQKAKSKHEKRKAVEQEDELIERLEWIVKKNREMYIIQHKKRIQSHYKYLNSVIDELSKKNVMTEYDNDRFDKVSTKLCELNKLSLRSDNEILEELDDDIKRYETIRKKLKRAYRDDEFLI